MDAHPTKRLISLRLILMASCLICVAAKASILDTLDLRIADRGKYEILKHEEIDRHKKAYEKAGDEGARYEALRGLYEAYRAFRIDSALIMAERRLEAARKLGINSKISSATLNLAEGYVKSGFPEEVIAIIDTLREENLEDYHRKYRDSILRNAYMLKAASALLPADRMEALEKLRQLRERTLAETGRDSKGFYILSAEKLMDAGLHKEAVAMVEEGDRKFDFSNDAALQYTMGEIYLANGEKEKAVEKLARSAILDITAGVKEYRSLILLADLLYEEGDIERAFNYINCAFEDAEFSKAKLRTPEIMKVMPLINRTFHDYENLNSERTRMFLWFAALMILVLLTAGFFLYRMLKANRRMLKEIETANTRLELHNASLKESDALKLSHINNLLLANAAYISRLKDFRKSVYRLMKTGQYDKALDTLKSDQADAKDIAAFHEMFDLAFLSMFPDFVADVNKLLKTPIELKNKSRLTPELRVIALMRLGITSTSDISGMLHYSSQTVYNLRTAIRSLTALPKEEFEARIKEI